MTISELRKNPWYFGGIMLLMGLTLGIGLGSELANRQFLQPLKHSVPNENLSLSNLSVRPLAGQEASSMEPHSIESAQTEPMTAIEENQEKATITQQVDNNSGRCTAITASGIQCKRKAQPGRNHCWQH